jgi:AcrR family transcriptional regulator
MIQIMTGLRERKKQQTRDGISAVATRLFVDHGFERVTIAEVAAAADVSKMTVTNYFPLKEDLVFDRREHIVTLLGNAVTERAADTSALDSIRRAYADALDRGDPTLGHRGVEFARMVNKSAALLAREREIFDQRERALADALIHQLRTGPGEVPVRLAAVHLDGVFRVLYYEGRRRLLAGQSEAEIVRALRRAAKSCFDQVEHGLPPALTASTAR